MFVFVCTLFNSSRFQSPKPGMTCKARPHTPRGLKTKSTWERNHRGFLTDQNIHLVVGGTFLISVCLLRPTARLLFSLLLLLLSLLLFLSETYHLSLFFLHLSFSPAFPLFTFFFLSLSLCLSLFLFHFSSSLRFSLPFFLPLSHIFIRLSFFFLPFDFSVPFPFCDLSHSLCLS